MKSLYLLLHLFTVAFPLIRSFEPRLQYARKWKALLPGLVVTGVFFITWDAIFTNHEIWGFNGKYNIGLHILSLPIEEWLFFITIPFASVFIYECVVYFFPKASTSITQRLVTTAVALCLIAIAIVNKDKIYTFWNFLFTGAFLGYTGYKNPSWLGKFWLAYLFLLFPFLLVNGVLTGSFIEEQVVWYNNQENLNIRIGTIPVEDFAYTLLLLLMNVTFFEWFKRYYGLNA